MSLVDTISPPLKWHGGKNYLASRIHSIAAQTPYVHRVITHAGGLGEMWNWAHEGISEIANDLNGWLVNFWNVLRDPATFEQLRRHLECTPFAETVYEASAAMIGRMPLGPDAGIDPVESAAWLFTCCRQSLAGRMKSFTPTSRNRTRRGMNEQVSAWMTAIEGLPAVHTRLLRVLIKNKDAIQLIKEEDSENTLFYCDPPYVPKTRTAPKVYAHEMTVEQHAELLDTLGHIKGKFLLSGYDHELYRDAEDANGWHRHAYDLPNNAAGGAEKRRMIEVIWCNFKSEGAES